MPGVKIDYNPYSLQYFGFSLEEESFARENKSKKFKIVGEWIDNTLPSEGVAMRIRYNNQGKLIKEYYDIYNPDIEASINTELSKTTKKGKTVFVNIEQDNAGEYYVLQSNGNLACYDNDGWLITLKKL